MMDGFSAMLIAAAPYLSAASAGVSVISSIMGGQQQAAAYEAQAAADRTRAEQARINAAIQLNQAEAEAARTQGNVRRRVATAFNQAAGSGGDPTYGSPLDLMGDIAAEGALDVQIQRWKGKLGANAALTQAGALDAQAGFADSAADAAGTAGFVRAGTTLLGGLAQYGTAQLRMQQPGYGQQNYPA